jgi:hypothetical protein
MNSIPSRDTWSRLAAAARSSRETRDESMPYGFATRVAALAGVQQRSVVSVFERFALRALGVACLLALGSFALNYRALVVPQVGSGAIPMVAVDDFEVAAPADDAVALVFDVAD